MPSRLLILSDADFVGGSEINYKILIPEFHQAGWEVHWITSAPTGNVQKILDASVFQFHPVLHGFLSLSDTQTKRFSFSNAWRNGRKIFQNIRLINRFVKEKKVDVVLSISMLSHFSQIFIQAPKKIAHIQDYINRKKAFGLYGVGLNIIVRRVDKVILCSSFLANNYPTHLRVKLQVIYNPLEEILTDKKPDPNRIGMFARYVSWKGHRDFIRIAEEAIKLDNTLEFVAFGNVSETNRAYYNALVEEVNRLGLSRSVFLQGFTPEVQDEMAKCSAILHLSTSPEPFGRIIVEAGQLGVPVLGYQGGGGTEIFEKFNIPGKLVEPGDVSGVAKMIMERQTFQNKASDLALLSKEHIAQEFIELFVNKG